MNRHGHGQIHDFSPGPFLLFIPYTIIHRSLLIVSTAALHPGRGLLADVIDTVRTPDLGLVPGTGPTETVEPSFLLRLFTLIDDKVNSEIEKEVRNRLVEQ